MFGLKEYIINWLYIIVQYDLHCLILILIYIYISVISYIEVHTYIHVSNLCTYLRLIDMSDQHINSKNSAYSLRKEQGLAFRSVESTANSVRENLMKLIEYCVLGITELDILEVPKFIINNPENNLAFQSMYTQYYTYIILIRVLHLIIILICYL